PRTEGGREVGMTRGRVAASGAASVLFVVFVAVMVLRPGGDEVVTAVDDAGTALAGLVAAGALAARARRAPAAARRSWLLLAIGTLCAAAGDVLWTWFEVVRQVTTPFPSVADALYLLFPVFLGLGVLMYPKGPRTGRANLRLVADGVLVA